MDANDLVAIDSGAQSRTRRTQISRGTIAALAFVWLGSMSYSLYAMRPGKVEHVITSHDGRERVTHVGFTSWIGVIEAPDHLEYSFQEIRLPNGEWVRHGRYTRTNRDGSMREVGFYREGQRDSRWTYWNADRSVDVERSGFYLDGARVGDWSSSPADPNRPLAQVPQ